MARKNAKKLIVESLMELMQETPLNKIDVQDIMAHCSLSRQTFYYNFKNKSDLVNWILEENNQKALAYFNNGGTLYDYIYHSLQMVRENRLFYRNLLTIEGEYKHFTTFFEEGFVSCAQTIENRCAIGKMNAKLWSSLHLFTFGAKGLLQEWVEEDFQQEPRQLAEIMMKSLPCRIDSYFQHCS